MQIEYEYMCIIRSTCTNATIYAPLVQVNIQAVTYNMCFPCYKMLISIKNIFNNLYMLFFSLINSIKLFFL